MAVKVMHVWVSSGMLGRGEVWKGSAVMVRGG